MRIGIVGASSAGLYAACLIKRDHPDYVVEVFDKEEKVGRKLGATGNGRCNLLNAALTPEDYNQTAFMKGALDLHPVSSLIETLASLGIPVQGEELLYPVSNSAKAYVLYLYQYCLSRGVIFHLGERVKDFDGPLLVSSSGKHSFDRLIFATGGASQPSLGSDGSLFDVFARKGIEIKPLKPCLCPIRTEEKTKAISGYRHAAAVSVMSDKKILFREEGEVLFKDDGLSGIVIFNAQRAIQHANPQGKINISLDLFPNKTEQELANDFLASFHATPSFLLAYFDTAFIQYLCQRIQQKEWNEKSIRSLASLCKNLCFSFSSPYPFASSQVTMGGVGFENLNNNLSLKKDNRIFFIGECVDMDGKCGGYNLSWCLLSALLATEAL